MIDARSPVSAEEQRSCDRADCDHLDIFGHEEQGELHAGIFDVVAGSQLLLGLRHIEGRPVYFRQGRDPEDKRSQRLVEHEPTNFFLLVDDVHQAHRAGQHDRADECQPQGQLVADHLG